MKTTTSQMTLFSTLLLATLGATGCMGEPPNFGMFPADDDPGVTATVSKEEAAAVAEVALQGINADRFDLWTTRWDESMLEAIHEADWEGYRSVFVGKYGRFEALEGTRLMKASDPAFVRFYFLARFEKGKVMLIQVYPKDGDEIFGVHIRDAATGEAP